jgi:lipopolysaccharide transport system permease protein
VNTVTDANDTSWNLILKPKGKLIDFNFKDLWEYRDLLILLVRRDIVTVYKQTLLGFFWFIIPPVLNALTYVIIFGLFAKVPTGSDNLILFYLSGVIAWGYFADCINRTSSTFRANASIFGKVYFPRLIVPMASVLSALVKFFVQFAFLIVVMAYFGITGFAPNVQWKIIWVLPFILLLMALSGMAIGLIISSLTTKYRDLSNIVPFAVQFLMYATPVIYPYTFFPENLRWIFDWNPLSPMIEIFRHLLMGTDRLNLLQLGGSALFTLVLLLIGLVMFNKTERNFMDTV